MNISEVSYSAIAMTGTLDDLKKKMMLEGKTVDDVKDILDSDMSLLMLSIAYGKLDIAKYLLQNNAKVNIVSKEGYNEFHCLAYHLKENNALELAYMLLEKDVDLNLRDKKFKNSAFWYLCYNACLCNTKLVFEFISKCIGKKPDLDSLNIAGKSIRDLIANSGIEYLQNIVN